MKAMLIFIVVLCLVSLSHSVNDSQCTTTLMYSQDCSWYLKCLQDKYHCGSKGYPIGYGYKYCNKFSKLQQKANPIVQKWIQNTLVCLKHSLIKYINQPQQFTEQNSNKICNTIKRDAFGSHPICYTSQGFCQIWKQLGVKGSGEFIKELLSVFELKDFIDYQAIKQIFLTIEICAKGIL